MGLDRHKVIAVLGTLDTKAREVLYLRDLFWAGGYPTVIIDVGFLTAGGNLSDITNTEVLKGIGIDIKTLVSAGNRDEMMDAMGRGAGRLLVEMHREGKLAGVIALGGNQGSAIGALAMRDLAFGLPKILISTVASGNIRPYVGCKDIGVFPAVGDLVGGPNPVTGTSLANAASALMGMAGKETPVIMNQPGVNIALSALGNTEQAASLAGDLLKDRGFQVIPFHASGAGGSAMEELIQNGIFAGVLDLTIHELTEEVVGAGVYQPVNPGRLKAAGGKGIPQVVSPGGMEYLCFGPRETIPTRFRKRRIYMHNPYNANVKATREELKRTALAMAERLNASRGPVAVMIPLRGWSVYGAEGGPLYDGKGNETFVKTLKGHLKKGIILKEIDARINDSPFVHACVNQLIKFLPNHSDILRIK